MALFGKGQQSSSFGAKPASSPQKPLAQKPVVVQKSTSSKPVPPKLAPAKPKTLFEQKTDWERGDFTRRVGKGMLDSEKKKLNQAFSPKLGAYISKGEATQELRKLKKEGYRAEKVRKTLEKQTGITKY